MHETILDEIKKYNDQISGGQFCCNLARCPKCGDRPEFFKLHEVRARSFRVIQEERSALKIDSFVCRWKCLLCNRTSTDYPPFALPYKRYAKGSVLGFSAHYVHEDTASYRRTAQSDGLAIFYESGEPETIDERRLAPSTIHRWVGFIARLSNTLRQALQLIREKSPASSVFRRFFPAPARKFRSDERRKLLEDCVKLFLVEIEYQNLFDVSIFPRLATANAWG